VNTGMKAKRAAKRVNFVSPNEKAKSAVVAQLVRIARKKLGLRRGHKERRLPQLLADADLKRFFRAIQDCGDVQHEILLKLLFYTAVRVSELVHIEVGDVDLDACKIFINRGKGAKDRTSCFRRASAWCSKATCTPRRAIDIYSRLGGSGRSRLDPVDIFGLTPGEAAVIRNVGGRITPATLQTMAMLRIVAKTSGGEIGPGWNLIVLHHTDCGINCLVHSPDLLAKYFGVAPAELDALAITDPYKSVVVDVAALKANPLLPGGFLVSGLVYDVATGRIEILVPPALLRTESHA
jgi:carbonic anhydrase